MNSLFSLTRLYLLGSLRRQAHLATLFLGVVLFMLPAYVNAFSLGVSTFEVVSKDFGLILISYFTLAMAVLLGSTTVPNDREARSIYPVLARPVSRGLYLAAHLLAVVGMLAGSLLFLGACLTLSIGMMVRHFDLSLSVALYGSFLQAVVIAAICMMASIRWSSAVSGALGVVLFIVGHLSGDLFRLILGPHLGPLGKALVPDLSVLALKNLVVHGFAIGPLYLLQTTLYASGWACLAWWAARETFEEVDL